MHPRMYLLLAAVVLAAAGCGKDSPPAPVAPPVPVVPPEPVRAGITFVSAAVSDTVESGQFYVVTAVARDANLKPLVNAHVFFSRSAAAPSPLSAGAFGFCDYDLSRCMYGGFGPLPAEVDSTDANGRVSAVIALGKRAGQSYLVIGLPNDKLSDSVLVTVRPGRTVLLGIYPKDTAIFVGDHLDVRVIGVDRFSNPSPWTASLSSPDTVVQIVGQSLVGRTFGRARVTGRNGAMTDTLHVSVLPTGSVSAVSTQGTESLSLDGTRRAHVATTSNTIGAPGPSWSRDGARLVLAQPVGDATRLFIADTLAVKGRLIADATLFSQEAGPEVEGDGWVYFGAVPAGAAGSAIYRVRLDGSGAPELVLGPLDPDAQPSMATPSRSPDGALLAFVAGSDIHVYDLTRRARRFSTAGRSPTFAPDGRLIAFINGNGHVAVTDPAHVVEREIGCYTGCVGRLGWSPDGRWLVAGDRYGGLRVISVDATVELTVPFTAGLYQPAWRP